METEGEQRGGHEAESQDEHGDAQIGYRCRTETGPEGNAGGIDEPMGKEKENLKNEDGKEWPGSQIRNSFLP